MTDCFFPITDFYNARSLKLENRNLRCGPYIQWKWRSAKDRLRRDGKIRGNA